MLIVQQSSPSIHYLFSLSCNGHKEAGANPSWWGVGYILVWLLLYKGQHIETDRHSLLHSYGPVCMSLEREVRQSTWTQARQRDPGGMFLLWDDRANHSPLRVKDKLNLLRCNYSYIYVGIVVAYHTVKTCKYSNCVEYNYVSIVFWLCCQWVKSHPEQ